MRKLHLRDLSGSAQKRYLFLSGWLGGPPLYPQKFGQPFLRLPFAIGDTERDLWLALSVP
ncbi:MAG: globin domain-containing protein [Burkholderiales bacterium]